MVNYPKISIITPSFNQGQYIEQTILSVLEQNYPNLEYIIIDGGSTDQTVEIIKKYEKHLKYWVSEPDKGHSDAVNKGLLQCTGDIFNWLNSDDYYEPNTFKTIAEAFINNPNALVVGGKERAFASDSGKTVEIYEGTNIEAPIEKLIYEGIIDQPPTFWRMQAVRSLGLLPTELHYTMDSYWWTKFLLLYGKSKVLKLNNVLTNFRLHTTSKTVSQQHKFIENRRAIRLAIAKQFRFHSSIVFYFSNNTFINLVEPFNINNLASDVSLSKLESEFALQIYPRYYMVHDYQNAKHCFEIAFRNNKFYKMYFDYLKLKVLPVKLMNLLRR